MEDAAPRLSCQQEERDLLSLCNKKGWIQGPEEPVSTFIARIALLQEPSLSAAYAQKALGAKAQTVEEEKLLPALAHLKAHVDIDASWATMVMSKQQMSLLQPAATWIFPSAEQERPLYAFIQVHPRLCTGLRGFKNLSRDEIFTHELLHLGRMAFPLSYYEEIIAYRCSKSLWRRYIGPLSTYSSTTSAALALSLSIAVQPFTTDYALAQQGCALLQSLLLALLLIASARLARCHVLFHLCLQRCQQLVPHHGMAIVYRLAAEEIELLATLQPQKIMEYAVERQRHCLRWRMIMAAYFPLSSCSKQ